MGFPNLQSSAAAAIPVWEAPNAAGGASFANITTNASTQVKAGVGMLRTLVVNTPGATSTVTLYDGTSTAGIKIATIDTATAFNGTYGVAFATGLFIVTAGGTAADITVTYA